MVAAPPKPRFRGAWHMWAFVLTFPAGALLVRHAADGGARAALVIYTLGVATMFGVSAAYHRVSWTPGTHRTMGRLDHSAIFLAIAGTYTPVAVVCLEGAARVVVLAVVWGGAVVGIALQWTPATPPRWLFTAVYALVGWVALLVVPQLWDGAGALSFFLLLAGGLSYTAGAVVYALQRPDPWPATFGFHEVFHALTVVAAALHYTAIAIVVI